MGDVGVQRGERAAGVDDERDFSLCKFCIDEYVEREGFERCFSILIVKNVVILRLTKIKKKRSFVGWRVVAARGEKRENVLAVRPGIPWLYALHFFCRRLGDE